MEDQLIDVLAQEGVLARELINRLLTLVCPALDAEGDWSGVSSQVEGVLTQGKGATLQRQAYQRTRRMEDVVDYIVAQTAKGIAQS